MQTVLDLPKTNKRNGAENVSLSAIEKFVKIALEEETAMTISPVSWETYNDFVSQTMDKLRNPLFYYENEKLLIMPKSPEHEFACDYIVLFINFVALEWSINCGSLGSATFRKEDLERGFEPDSCFYFANEPKIRGVKRLDMTIHPAPDLIIEVDVTSSSEMRESIFAQFGVPELWRFENDKIEFLKLAKKKYVPIENSLALPLLTAEKLTEFISEAEKLSRLEWLDKVRNWAREMKR